MYEYDKVELYFDTNLILEDGLGGQYGPTGHARIAPDPKEDGVDGTLISYDLRGPDVNYAFKVTKV